MRLHPRTLGLALSTLALFACADEPQLHAHETVAAPLTASVTTDDLPTFIDSGDFDATAPPPPWKPLDPVVGGAVDAIKAGAAEIPFPMEVAAKDVGVRIVDVIDAAALKATDGTFALFEVFGVPVKVVNDRTSSRAREVKAKVTLAVGSAPLEGLLFQRTYAPTSDGDVRLASVAVVVPAPDGGTSAAADTLAIAPLDIPLHDHLPGSGSNSWVPGNLDCEGMVIAQALALGPMSASAPPVIFPEFKTYGGCTLDECVMIRRSWLLSHYYSWLLYRWAEYFEAMPKASRTWAWAQPGHGPGPVVVGEAEPGVPGPDNWSIPAAWFGSYVDYRWDAIRQTLHKIYDNYRKGETGGIKFKHQCDPQGSSNVCQSIWPIAHHWVKGWINYCFDFFRPNVGQLVDFPDNPARQRVHISMHESIHHLYTSWWKGGLFKWKMVKDHHRHEHGETCGQGPLEAMITLERVGHLASYTNTEGDTCGHRENAIINVDSYAQMITLFGELVHRGIMVGWPMPADPTPQPPGNCELGTLGCLCAPVPDDDVPPDGDAAPGTYCVDDDGEGHALEVSCALTTFNADDVVGVCRSCEDGPRPGGCACTHDDDCAPGLSCFGEDTAGGPAVGRCYASNSPPAWACQADCAKLTNDDYAWCDQQDPMGGHCYDSLCDPLQVDTCANLGKTCRDGDCVIECSPGVTCQDQGYPPGFLCLSGACYAP